MKAGKGNWVLMFGLFIVGMAVLVMATTPVWVGSEVNYTVVEGVDYYHNLSKNITGFADDVIFEINPTGENPIYFTNGSGRQSVSEVFISSWISIVNSSTGNFTINAIYNNQTGFFEIPIQAKNTTDAGADLVTSIFEFIINATNDVPNFTSSGINSSYIFDSDESVQNFTLTASDEEGHFPLIFNVTFNSTNCTHGAGTGYSDNSNCNLSTFGLTLTNSSNETATISFAPNSSYVGTYWANVSVMDAAVNYDCPHDWCDATYNTTNLTTYYSEMVKFTVSPILSIDESNCTGATLMEDEEFNCTIVITTPGEDNSLTLASNAAFRNVGTSPDNSSWFYSDNSVSAANFNYNVSVSVTPTKADVGNWTINFTADNGDVAAISKLIYLYVNYTESNVTLDAVSDMTLYENYSFSVNAVDEDLLVRDSLVKSESLTFASNTSWVDFTDSIPTPIVGNNFSTVEIVVDYDYVLANNGTGNYSVFINVTDEVGNTDNSTFIIQILNETAPVWDDTLGDPVSLNLTEGTAFTYNVSVNVSDAENDSLTFYYENVSVEFCSLNSTTFNSTSGIISFTPTDCDVGYHNVTIIASDGKLNSTAKQFNFTVNNVVDNSSIFLSANNGTSVPIVSEGFTLMAAEDSEVVFNLTVDDDDFLIPSGQRDNFYNESLIVNVTATNSTGGVVDLFNFSLIGMSSLYDSRVDYNASFTSSGAQVDNYTIFVNVTDFSGASTNRTFYLNITEISNSPEITSVANQSVTIYDVLNFTVSAIDEEDDRSGLNVSYSIANLTVGAPNLTIGDETGVVSFNMSSNSSYAGVWNYTVTVTDSDAQTNSTTVWLYVYGAPNITAPINGTNHTFNLNETVQDYLNFTLNHSVADNLTVKFYIDNITCTYENASNCSYSNLTLVQSINASGNNSQYNWSYTPSYYDETYGNLKNLTLVIYPASSYLTDEQKNNLTLNFTYKLNITHTNYPVEKTQASIGPQILYNGASNPINFTLSDYFKDIDYLDSYYQQNVTFTINSDASSSIIVANAYNGNRLNWTGLIDDWILYLYGDANRTGSETLIVYANDSYNVSGSYSFDVSVRTPPSTFVPVPTPSRGGGSSTKLKHYSLKLIAPQDIIISEMGFIDIPFVVQNNGQIDLRGISLSSFVRFNDAFADDIKISLGDNYIDQLKFGQSENFTMRITANTQRAGKYKATIIANVTSPKFSDFADFYIEIKKANESEAEQILIFTEKFVADNPECLELTELLVRAEEAFSLGEYSNSIKLAREVTDACEDAIEANEQIRYKVEGFVQDNFFYISFATLVIFFMGFIFYVYKRVRFNKSGMDEHV